MNKKHIPLVIIVSLIVISIFVFFITKQSVSKNIDFHNNKYVGAKKCKSCHLENFKSWNKTYHSTMTQEASESTVLGDFNGQNLTYWNFTIRPIKKNGKFYFEYYNPESGKMLNSLEILRTVGSRRYQQYLAKTENTQGNYYRLELLWHIEDKRWVHLNGAFLGSDHQSFSNHNAIWNQNCIFCHNTGIEPNMTNYDEIVEQTRAGKPLNLNVDSRFKSHVSDLGIGCESCHANGDEHIKLNQNPIRKYFLHFTDYDDKSIINPSKLSPKRAMDVCGQCHGQRTPKTYDLARKWMESGPTYRPGDALLSHVNLVQKKSKLNNKTSDMFRLRFWSDGTPRLSAYEYQGLSQSQCHIKGELTCNDCHSMHDGNPKGMIKDNMLTNKACISCHQKYATNVSKHTKHKANTDGSLCYSCHMPKTVYGVMTYHRSHKIESPDPIYEFSHDKPNACIACHVDKSSNWVVTESKKLWPKLNAISKQHSNLVQSIFKLHSGDPVERGIVAKNLSNNSVPLTTNEKLFLIPHLLYSMTDQYPAIRRFSYKSLQVLLSELSVELNDFENIRNSLKDFDFIADEYLRTRLVKKASLEFIKLDKTSWTPPPQGAFLSKNYELDIKSILQLREISNSEEKKIDIGE